jgi:hypothetical protein
MPSGIYKRTNENKRVAEKIGRYKIFGLLENNFSEEFFYIGTTKNYLCNVKAYMQYVTRKDMHPNNALYIRLKALDGVFEIKEIERLPRDFTFEQSKLYLQEHYLDIDNELLVNKCNYCFCPKDKTDWSKKLEFQKHICELYSSGVSSSEILKEYDDMDIGSINYILAKNGVNKKKVIQEVIEKYKSGVSLEWLTQEYSLTKYMISKIKQQ